MSLDLPTIRRQFPALSIRDASAPRIYLDNREARRFRNP